MRRSTFALAVLLVAGPAHAQTVTCTTSGDVTTCSDGSSVLRLDDMTIYNLAPPLPFVPPPPFVRPLRRPEPHRQPWPGLDGQPARPGRW